MQRTVEAIFDGEVFRPAVAPDLQANTRCVLHIEQIADSIPGANAWKTLRTLTGSVEAPEDWALQHDHYLYGVPKSHQNSTE
jgi:hypothetical protein